MIYAYTGSRKLFNVDIKKYIKKDAQCVVTGGTKMVDNLVEKYAFDNFIENIIVRPNYIKYGEVAPLMRNKLIVNKADMLIAIWDGKSKGTKHAIDYALQLNKPVEVHILN